MDRCVLHTLLKTSTFQTQTHKAEQKWNHQALQVAQECFLTEKTQLPKHRLYKQAKWSWESFYEHLQVKLLFPNRVQISKNRFCPLLCFTHLNGYIRITGPSFVFGLQTLSTQHWKEKRGVTTITQRVHTPCEAAARKGQKNRNITHESFSDEPQLMVHYNAWSRSNFHLLPVHGAERDTGQKNPSSPFSLASHQPSLTLGSQARPWEPLPPSLTRDRDLCWPFWGAIEHTLFHRLHLLSMCQFALTKHISDQVKDLWLVPLPDFHTILHGHDEILGSVFSSMLWALLCCPCAPESTECSSETDKIVFHWIWTAGTTPRFNPLHNGSFY